MLLSNVKLIQKYELLGMNNFSRFMQITYNQCNSDFEQLHYFSAVYIL